MFGIKSRPPAPEVKPRSGFTPEQCSNCTFVLDVPDPVNGVVNYCRRFPPTTMLIGHNQIGPVSNTIYPAVQENMWCGEYQRRS
jgi:hypothetical protein